MRKAMDRSVDESQGKGISVLLLDRLHVNPRPKFCCHIVHHTNAKCVDARELDWPATERYHISKTFEHSVKDTPELQTLPTVPVYIQKQPLRYKTPRYTGQF